MAKESIEETIVSLINKAGRSPYLFVGSGFSRRHMGTDSWEGLLRHLCMRVSGDPFRFEAYRARCVGSSPYGDLPAVATMLDRDLRIAVLEEDCFESFREEHAEDIRAQHSILKIMAAERLDSFEASTLTSELDVLREVGRWRVSGVITTNYDNLLESVFPEFKVFIGQDDLIFQRTFEVGEIYKIHGSVDKPESMVLDELDYKKLDETQEYLTAKLLTIFMEYPIVFVGYSLNDPDIQNILRSMAHCLGTDHLTLLRDRFVFVTRGEDKITTRTISYPGIGEISMTQVETNDFGMVYEAIGQSRCSFSPRVIRDLRKSIYEMVDGEEPSGSLVVEASFSDLERIPEGQSLLLGVGVANATVGHGHVIKAELLYRDIVLDDEYVAPKLAVEEYLPNLLGSNSGGLPMYKYLSAYSGEVLDRRIMKEIDRKKELDDFLNASLRKARANYHSGGVDCSVKSVVEDEGFDEAYKKLVLLEEAEIDLEDLLGYLRKLVRSDCKIIDGNTELKRLIRIYDFLKYKKAFNKSANSGNPT